MSIKITAKNDFSFLFNSMSTMSGAGATNLNFISDYASIKNGSYGKLMKAYYGKNAQPAVVSEGKTAEKKINSKDTTGKITSQALASVQKNTDSLKESADVLLDKGEKSLFKDEKITEDMYKAVSKLVSDYNSVLEASDKVNQTSVLDRTLTLVNATASNKALLGKVGISINSDNSLSLNQKDFMAADFFTVKGLFNTTGGYAYRVSAQSSLINYAADREVAKANTYNANGTLGKFTSTGNLFDSIF